MSPLTRRFLKTAVFFLAFGLVLGVVMIVRRELLGRWPTPWWVSAHTHAILVGFVMMMILGVALWMFPRLPGDRRTTDPPPARLAYWLVTLGTAFRVVGELLHTAVAAPAIGWVVVLGGTAQAAGLVAFFATIWGRIRGRSDEVSRAA